MAIRINTQIVHASIASVLKEIDPSANIFDNPNQQGTPYPAWFIVHRSPVEIQKEIKRYVLVYQIDIWYMLKQNITRLYDQYSAIAEQLDDKLEYLPVFGGDGAVVHVYDRSWGLELNALKYSITLKFRCSRDTVPDEYMQVIQDLFVFLKMQNEAILSFQNTSHPEFDAQLPNPISVTKGRSVNMPFVGGEFEDDNYKWTPSGWTLGNFGALIQLNESMTADLLWRSEEKTASLSFTNTLYPEFDVELPDTIIANKGSSVELPAVSGTFPVGSFDWNPSSWDIGSFGGSFILNEDTTADLQWESKEVFFDISFTNTSHPEFDVTLPQSEHVSRGSSVTLPTVEGEFIQGNYKWNPDIWDIGAFGTSYTPSDNVSANLLWRSEEIPVELPTVSTSGDFDANNWVTTIDGAVIIISINGVTKSYIKNGSSINEVILSASDQTKKYAVIKWQTDNEAFGGRTELNCQIGSSRLYIHNQTTSTLRFMRARLAVCSDMSSTVVNVYKISNSAAYNAFKYTINGTDYYYVLDEIQTGWTDDLNSIGYSSIDAETDIDVVFGSSVSIPDGYSVQSVKSTKAYAFGQAEYVYNTTYTMIYRSKNLLSPNILRQMIGVKTIPVLTVFQPYKLSGTGSLNGYRLSTSPSYDTGALSSLYDASVNTDPNIFVKFTGDFTNSTAATNSSIGANSGWAAMFRVQLEDGKNEDYFFNLPNTLWSFDNGVFSWLEDASDFSKISYFYNIDQAPIRIHCILGDVEKSEGTVSSLALPSEHVGSYYRAYFSSSRYYVKGVLSNTGSITQYYFGQSTLATWYYGTVTWEDRSIGNLRSAIFVNPTSASALGQQTVFRIIFITGNKISGYHPWDAQDTTQSLMQITSYTYNNGVHSITFYSSNSWFGTEFDGRLQIRYLDETVGFENLYADGIVSINNGVLQKDTTSDRYDMYNAYNGEIELSAYSLRQPRNGNVVLGEQHE